MAKLHWFRKHGAQPKLCAITQNVFQDCEEMLSIVGNETAEILSLPQVIDVFFPSFVGVSSWR